MSEQKSKIIKAENIENIKKELKNISKKTLVIFDCDDVLTTTHNQILKKQNRVILEKLFKEYCSEANPAETLSIIVSSSKNVCVNEQMPALVNYLLEKNIFSVVLTKFSPNSLGNLDDPKVWRVQILNSLGYNFEKFWTRLLDMDFEDYSYYKGIIFCGDSPKSLCLEKFIKYSKIAPDKIILIDDNLNQIQDVKNFCESSNIPFIGIEYCEAEIMPPSGFSESIAEYQFKTFAESNMWVSEEKIPK